MPKLLKVLHVEDDFDYSEMFQLQINRIAKKKDCEELLFDIVASVEEALQKMDKNSYDCIVCDYQIFNGNGLDCLKEIRKINDSVPIIFLTGQGDEQVAREAFVHGANDYFTKDVVLAGYDRIYNSILRHVELFEISIQKEEAEKKYRTIFETASTAIIILEEDRTISLVNSKFEELSGYTKEEVENRKKWTEFVTKDDLERMKKYHRNRRVDGKSAPSEYEFQFVTKDGGVRDIFLSVGMIPGTKRSVASFLDITEEKRISKRIEHLNSVLKAIRNVNQMVVKEKNKNALLQKTCDTLIETRGYTAAWIGLLKDDKYFPVIKGAGFEKYISLFSKEMLAGNHPYCIKKALSKKEDVMLFYDRGDECEDCFFKGSHPEEGVAIMRIEHENELFGLLAIMLAPGMTINEEEKGLLTEVAGDVAFSLHMMELEEKRRKAEESLLESEERYRLIAENTNDTISLATFCLNPVFTYVSPSCRLSGYEPEELIGKPCFDFVHSDDKKKLLQMLRRYISAKAKKLLTGKEQHISESIEHRHRDKSGNWHHLQVTVNLVGNQMLFVTRDITEQKKAEEALRKERNFNDTLVQASPTFFVAISADGKTIMMNESMLRTLGYTKEEVTGKDYLTTFVPECDRKILSNVFKKLVKFSEATLNENHLLTKDGRKLLAEWHGKPVFKENGEYDFFFGVGIDITEKKRAEDALRESEKRYRTLFEDSRDAIWTATVKGEIIDANEAALELLGYTKEEFIGMNALNLYIAPKDRFKFQKEVEKNGSVKNYELELKKKDGAKINCLFTASVWGDKDGGILGYRGNVRDITERKKAENLLKQQREELSEFAHTTAHDIRNPLLVIKGYAELLKEGDETEMSTKIIKQIDTLDEFIRRNLALANAGKANSYISDVDLNVLIGGIAKIIIPKNMDFITDNLPAIKCDPQRCKQLFQNLFINAIEHGKPKKIEVKYIRKGDWHTISVKDDGKGISSKEMGRIFEKGYTTSASGNGFGLAIVEKIVKAHSGKINVESKEGEGTIFTIMLPIVPNFQE